jgi:hypothetical protein
MARFVQLTAERWINLDTIAYVTDYEETIRVGLAVTGYSPAFDGHTPHELVLSPNERTALLLYLHDQAQKFHCQPLDVYPPDAQDEPGACPHLDNIAF